MIATEIGTAGDVGHGWALRIGADVYMQLVVVPYEAGRGWFVSDGRGRAFEFVSNADTKEEAEAHYHEVVELHAGE